MLRSKFCVNDKKFLKKDSTKYKFKKIKYQYKLLFQFKSNAGYMIYVFHMIYNPKDGEKELITFSLTDEQVLCVLPEYAKFIHVLHIIKSVKEDKSIITFSDASNKYILSDFQKEINRYLKGDIL